MASRAAAAARAQLSAGGIASADRVHQHSAAERKSVSGRSFSRSSRKSCRRASISEERSNSFLTGQPIAVKGRVWVNSPHKSFQARAEGSGNGASGPASQAAKRPEYIPNRIDDPNYVRIFDTTLRDGEQSPGATLTSKEKLDVARQLARLGVDIIEAGFPRASPDDLEAVRNIAKEVGNAVDETGYVPVICGLARCNKQDIDAAWEGVRHAKRPRIHVFLATSEIHMKYKLKKTKDEVVETARNMVAYCRSLGCNDVEFSPEDAGRWV